MQHTANSKGIQEAVLLPTEPARVENKDLILQVAEHDYKTGKVDWKLTADEQMAMVLKLAGTGTDGANAITESIAGKLLVVINDSSQAITVKATGKTGVAVASKKTAVLMGDGEDFIRITADA